MLIATEHICVLIEPTVTTQYTWPEISCMDRTKQASQAILHLFKQFSVKSMHLGAKMVRRGRTLSDYWNETRMFWHVVCFAEFDLWEEWSWEFVWSNKASFFCAFSVKMARPESRNRTGAIMGCMEGWLRFRHDCVVTVVTALSSPIASQPPAESEKTLIRTRERDRQRERDREKKTSKFLPKRKNNNNKNANKKIQEDD